MAAINAANIDYINMQDRVANPTATPATDYTFFFVKNGQLYLKLDDTTVVGPLGTSTVTDLNSLSDVTVTSPTKGMILVYNGSGWVTLTAGTNGYVLATNSASSTGVEWIPNSSDTTDAQLIALLGW